MILTISNITKGVNHLNIGIRREKIKTIVIFYNDNGGRQYFINMGIHAMNCNPCAFDVKIIFCIFTSFNTYIPLGPLSHVSFDCFF